MTREPYGRLHHVNLGSIMELSRARTYKLPSLYGFGNTPESSLSKRIFPNFVSNVFKAKAPCEFWISRNSNPIYKWLKGGF